jgi:hypothetical protein
VNDGTNIPAPPPAGATSRVREILSLVDGLKTYVVVIAAVVYLIGSDCGWWAYNEQVLALFGFGGIAALRNSVRKTTR